MQQIASDKPSFSIPIQNPPEALSISCNQLHTDRLGLHGAGRVQPFCNQLQGWSGRNAIRHL